MTWSWQEVISRKYTRQSIFDDMLKDESILFDLAKEDVAKILQKTNYKFVVQKMAYDDIYPLAASITKIQLKKFLHSKKGFFKCTDNCELKNLELVKRIVQRIANNIKNLFDERYKTCIKQDLSYLKHEEIATAIDENDPLSIMLLEEEEIEVETKLQEMNKEYVEHIANIIKIDSDGQTSLSLS